MKNKTVYSKKQFAAMREPIRMADGGMVKDSYFYNDNLLKADKDNAMSERDANSTGLTTDQLHDQGITLQSDLMHKSYYDPTSGIYDKRSPNLQYAKGGIVAPVPNPGAIKGPGTGTSDSIPAKLPVNSAIIPAKATKKIGKDVLDKLIALAPTAKSSGKETVPAKISNGETFLPDNAVKFLGKSLVNKLINYGSDAKKPVTTVKDGVVNAAGGIDPDALNRINELTGVTGGRQASVPLPADQANAQLAQRQAASEIIQPVASKPVSVPQGKVAETINKTTGVTGNTSYRPMSKEAADFTAETTAQDANFAKANNVARLNPVATQNFGGTSTGLAGLAVAQQAINNPVVQGQYQDARTGLEQKFGKNLPELPGQPIKGSIASKIEEWATKPLPIFAKKDATAAIQQPVANQPVMNTRWDQLTPEQQAAQIKEGNASIQKQIADPNYAPRALQMLRSPEGQQAYVTQENVKFPDGAMGVRNIISPEYEKTMADLQSRLTPDQRAQEKALGEGAALSRKVDLAGVNGKARLEAEQADAPMNELLRQQRLQGDLTLEQQKKGMQIAKDMSVLNPTYSVQNLGDGMYATIRNDPNLQFNPAPGIGNVKQIPEILQERQNANAVQAIKQQERSDKFLPVHTTNSDTGETVIRQTLPEVSQQAQTSAANGPTEQQIIAAQKLLQSGNKKHPKYAVAEEIASTPAYKKYVANLNGK